MPRTVNGGTGPGFGLTVHRGMRKHLREEQLRPIESECLMGDRANGFREQRTLAWNCSEVLSGEKCLQFLNRHHAMVLPVHSAARRKTRLRIATSRKQRRDQREAEHQQQRDGNQTSHRGFANHIIPRSAGLNSSS